MYLKKMSFAEKKDMIIAQVIISPNTNMSDWLDILHDLSFI